MMRNLIHHFGPIVTKLSYNLRLTSKTCLKTTVGVLVVCKNYALLQKINLTRTSLKVFENRNANRQSILQ